MIARAERERIIRDYAARHNGRYDPAGFVAEVRAAGAEHPAFGWFTWDDDAAAERHRLWEARRFATGLRVVFSVETVERAPVRVSAPLAVSPVSERAAGGGYRLVARDSDAGRAELVRQAAAALRSWAERNDFVLTLAGIDPGQIEALAARIDAVSDPRP